MSQLSLLPGEVMIGGADFSEDRVYRYLLWRSWDSTKPWVGFICLNPSTADEKDPDQTLTRLINFSKSWGYGGLLLGNLFAFRTPYTEVLHDAWKGRGREAIDVVGERNNNALLKIAREAQRLVVAWGAPVWVEPRAEEVGRLLVGTSFWCIRKTAGGAPEHPLYLPGHLEAARWP